MPNSLSENLLRRFATAVLVAVLPAVVAVSNASGEPIALSTPAGLNPGDRFRFAFLTAGTTTGTSTDIATYNSFVNAQAGGATHNGSTVLWTALGSTATVDARDNIGGFGSSVPVYLTTGVKVAGDMTTSPTDAGFWSGVLYATINYDVSGNSISEFSQVFTGSLQNGLKDQTNPLGSTFPRSGSPGFHSVGSAFWIYNNNGFAPFGQVMYAVSEELIVPVPEPSTYAMALAGVACGCFSMWRRRKRA